MWIDRPHVVCHVSYMARGDASVSAISGRLVALRRALDYENASAFARTVGLGVSALQNYEAGLRRPDIDQAILICRATGVTLDWIYQGLTAGLPHHIETRLQPPATEQRAS
jgi:transcriptional regulator with XRE-family HTH domain